MLLVVFATAKKPADESSQKIIYYIELVDVIFT
jgi:hypothetical protein